MALIRQGCSPLRRTITRRRSGDILRSVPLCRPFANVTRWRLVKCNVHRTSDDAQELEHTPNEQPEPRQDGGDQHRDRGAEFPSSRRGLSLLIVAPIRERTGVAVHPRHPCRPHADRRTQSCRPDLRLGEGRELRIGDWASVPRGGRCCGRAPPTGSLNSECALRAEKSGGPCGAHVHSCGLELRPRVSRHRPSPAGVSVAPSWSAHLRYTWATSTIRAVHSVMRSFVSNGSAELEFNASKAQRAIVSSRSPYRSVEPNKY